MMAKYDDEDKPDTRAERLQVCGCGVTSRRIFWGPFQRRKPADSGGYSVPVRGNQKSKHPEVVGIDLVCFQDQRKVCETGVGAC